MPTYDYACAKCGHEFELVQSMKDEALKVCPKEKCGRKRWGRGRVQRQVGIGAGLIFKGSGFYITDYRSEGYKAAAKKESGADTGGGKTEGAKAEGGAPSASAKGDGKAAPKPETKAAPAPKKPAE